MPYKMEIPKRSEAAALEEVKVPVTIVDPSGERTVEVWKGYRLWDAMLDARSDFWRICGGDGVCGTCRVEVAEGMENLSPKTPLEKSGKELDWLTRKLVWLFWLGHGIVRRPPNWRLACQTYVQGPVRVEWKENLVQKALAPLRSRPEVDPPESKA